MEKSLEIVDQTTEVSNTEQMDEDLFKEFLSKTSVWDFHNMARDEYTSSNPENEFSGFHNLKILQ